MSLPTEAEERKQYPVATGVVDYFPDALSEIGHVSFVGNEQHNLGTPLHWDRSKSTDEADALMRHFIERGKRDSDGLRHSAKLAWRALALLQKEIEVDRAMAQARKAQQEAMNKQLDAAQRATGAFPFSGGITGFSGGITNAKQEK